MLNKQARQASVHSKVRYLGILMFLIGLVLIGASVVGVVLQVGSWGDIAVSLFATGISLGVFGAHNDTMLAILRDIRGQKGISKSLNAEIDEEYLFNRLDLSDLQSLPKTAWFITFSAPLVIFWAAWRLSWIIS